MKIRKGFVTNSSSSSFILAYNKNELEENIRKQLNRKYNKEDANEYFEYLMRFINKVDNEKQNKELFNQIEKSLYWIYRYALQDELEHKGMDYLEIRNFIKSDKGKNEIEKRIKKRMEEIKTQVKSFNTIKKIRITDDYEPLSSLEKEVVENLQECIQKFDGH